jgi:hypothetical protein
MTLLPRLGLALSGWAAAAFTVLPAAAFPRVLVVAAFLLVCPGTAALRWVRPPGEERDPERVAVLESGVLAVVLSLALSVLVAEALFVTGIFTLARALLILAALTSVLALLPSPGHPGLSVRGRVRRSVKRRSTTAGPPR